MSNMLPSPDILNNMDDGKFVLTNLAAKRAKQLREGAPPLVSVESNHPLTIALAEIAAGKIKPIVQALEEGLEVEEGVYDKVTEEPLPPELGMLLPALDETEVVLVDADLHGEEEAEIGPEVVAVAGEGMTISDLVEEEVEGDESEAAPVIGEEETLSLSDIAEQETTLEEEEEHEE